MPESLDAALKGIPDALRRPLIEFYQEALSEYRAGRWEAVGTKAGKLCEVVYSIVDGQISGQFPAKPSKPRNMLDACRDFEQHNKARGRSLCIQIPRLLTAVYEMRNNRDIGHVGSDVDPNHMDAELMIRSVKWLMAELVRNFASVDVETARELVEAVTERSFHVVWTDGDAKRVLNTRLRTTEQVLVLLYESGGKAGIDELIAWTEYGNKSRFRKTVLASLHRSALVHVNESTMTVTLLPPGLRMVEERGYLIF